MTPPSKDRFAGCLLGLALGDALGAPFEGGPIERLTWRVIGRTRANELRWTDDTQMSLDIAESWLACRGLDPDDLARRFARSHRWSRGYGPGASRMLKRIARGMPWQRANRSVFADGSFGNGGAMRAPVVALCCASGSEAQLTATARDTARITHAHPLGIEGAVLVASAAARALRTDEPAGILEAAIRACTHTEFRDRLVIARGWLADKTMPSPKTVSTRLGTGIAAVDSCPTAIYLASRFSTDRFESLQAFVARCGGDTDTIGAMAGAIWGAIHGAAELPAARLQRLEAHDRIRRTAAALHELVTENATG